VKLALKLISFTSYLLLHKLILIYLCLYNINESSIQSTYKRLTLFLTQNLKCDRFIDLHLYMVRVQLFHFYLTWDLVSYLDSQQSIPQV